MNQSQFVDEIMTILFGKEYEYMSDEDCSYELAIGMIKQKYEEKKSYPRRPSLRETQAMQAYNRGGY